MLKKDIAIYIYIISSHLEFLRFHNLITSLINDPWSPINIQKWDRAVNQISSSQEARNTVISH